MQCAFDVNYRIVHILTLPCFHIMDKTVTLDDTVFSQCIFSEKQMMSLILCLGLGVNGFVFLGTPVTQRTISGFEEEY